MGNMLRENCIIVGLCGRMGSGKDYIANVLCKNYFHELKSMNVSFADQLKVGAMLFENRGAPAADIESPDNLEIIDAMYNDYFVSKPEDVRKHIQTYGENLRTQNPNIWVHTLYVEMLKQWHVNNVKVFVISDVRYPKEVEFIKEVGGTMIRVNSPRRVAHVCSKYMSTSVNNHVSESFVDVFDPDFEVDNDISLGGTNRQEDLVVQLNIIADNIYSQKVL